MKKILNLFLVSALLLSSFFPYVVSAHNRGGHISSSKGRFVDIVGRSNAANDGDFLYVLGDTTVAKYSLPDFTLVLSKDLPKDTRGTGINVVNRNSGNLILVSVQSSGDKSSILSYDTNLQFIATLDLKTVEGDIQTEENDDDNKDNDGNNEDNNDGDNNSSGD